MLYIYIYIYTSQVMDPIRYFYLIIWQKNTIIVNELNLKKKMIKMMALNKHHTKLNSINKNIYFHQVAQ